jgi:Spy/CpxP family protein refolding chaperone
MMQKSKSMAVIFLLVAFVAGAALGYAADRMFGRAKPGSHGRESMSVRVARELSLTPEQSKSLDSLMERRREQIREVYRPIRPQLDSLDKVGREISDSTHAQVRRILTAEQQVKWDAMRDRARKNFEASRKRFNERR